MGDNTAGDDGETAKWRCVYAELLRIERNWTQQIQDQETRISALLQVSSILLGFLTGAGFLARLPDPDVLRWPVYLYVGSLVSLCFALFMGIRALKPRIRIAGTTRPLGRVDPEPPPMWLNQKAVLGYAGSASEGALLRELCESAVKNQDEACHPRQLDKRRTLMLRQYAFLMLALTLLIGALAGALVSRSAHCQ